MRALSFVLLIITPFATEAQQNAKGYVSSNDYTANVSRPLPGVNIRRANAPEARGEYVYYIKSIDKKAHKTIQQDCWAVERNDSVFVNCNQVFKTKETNKGLPYDQKIKFYTDEYAHVLFRSQNYLHFRGGRSNTFGIPPPFRGGDVSGTHALLAATGSVANSIMAASDDQKRFHYLYDFKAGKVIYFNRGVMRNLVKQLSPEDDAEFIAYINKLIAEEK